MNDYTSKIPNDPPLIVGKEHHKGTEAFPRFKFFWDYLASVNLTPTQARVLFKMFSYMDYENWIKVSQTTLAEDLNIEPQNIQPAVKRLVELEIIEMLPDPQDRRRKHYRLNARFGWKENPREWNKYVSKKSVTVEQHPNNFSEKTDKLSKDIEKAEIEKAENNKFFSRQGKELQQSLKQKISDKEKPKSSHQKPPEMPREQIEDVKTIDEINSESHFEKKTNKRDERNENIDPRIKEQTFWIQKLIKEKAAMLGNEEWGECMIAHLRTLSKTARFRELNDFEKLLRYFPRRLLQKYLGRETPDEEKLEPALQQSLEMFRKQLVDVKTTDETNSESRFEEEMRTLNADKEKLVFQLQQLTMAAGTGKWSEDMMVQIEALPKIATIEELECHKTLLNNVTKRFAIRMQFILKQQSQNRKSHSVGNVTESASNGKFIDQVPSFIDGLKRYIM